MFTFYRYIFGKLYFFSINIFKEKEFPWAFAAGVIGFILMINFTVLLDLIELIMLPDRINNYEKYDNWLALIWLAIVWIYAQYDHRYKRIIERYNEIPLDKKRMLGILSVLYVVLSFASLLYIGHLHRVYNGFD